jgi:arylsulfatase A-like enzyme
MLLQGVPFFLSDYRDNTLTRFYYPIHWDHLVLYLLCIPVLTHIELSVLLFLVEITKHHMSVWRASKFVTAGRWTITIFAELVVTAYFLVIYSSWFYYSQTGYFLGLEMLNLFPLLFDFRFIVGTFAPVNLLQLILILGTSMALGCWFVLFAPAQNFHSLLTRHGRNLLLSLGTALALAVLPTLYLPPLVAGVYRANSFFALSPQWSLLWAHIRYGRFEPELPSVSLNLVPIGEGKFPQSNSPPQKNVFLFVVEALRADAIDPLRTPTLYRLAQEGISFDNSYSQSTETSESMLSIITSRYPLRSQLRNRETKNRNDVHVYDGLAQTGYITGYIGEEWSQDSILTDSPGLLYRFNPLIADYSKVEPADNPFHYKNRGLGDYSLAVADRLKVRMLQKLVDRSSAENKKVFSILYFISSHFPYDQTDGVASLVLPNELVDTYNFLSYPKQIAPIMHNRYLNTIHYIDSLVGSFIEFLKRKNQLSNSLILLTGDHGEEFWEHNRVTHSQHLDQEAIRVPLIIWGASGFRKKWSPMTPVSHIDIAPTIYKLLNLPQQPSFQGESVLISTREPLNSTPDPPLFISTQALMHEDAVILWPWKLVRNLWGEGARMFRLDQDPKESQNILDIADPNARLLCGCIIGFRASQLHYYSGLGNLEGHFFPPRYDVCPTVKLNSRQFESYCAPQKTKLSNRLN